MTNSRLLNLTTEKGLLMRVSTAIPVFVVSALTIAQSTCAQENGIESRQAFFAPEDRAKKFQSAEAIFPIRVVKAGNARKLKKSSQPWTPPDYMWNNQPSSFEDFNRRNFTSAILILKADRILHEEYRCGSNEDTRFMSFSAAKSITSTLVGMAIEDGFIRTVDDKLTEYLPALIGSAYADVTIKDALQMMSGVKFEGESFDLEDESIPFSKAHNESISKHWYRFVEAANGLEKKQPAGEKFDYNTMNPAILGWLVENATRKRLSTYMEERMWKPCGMESNAAWILDGPPEVGREMAGGLFTASLRDYGRFGLLFSNNGKANGKQLISGAWVKAASTADREPIQCGNLYEDYDAGYGYQWWLRPNGQYSAIGVYGQFICIEPKQNIVMVKLSHWPKVYIADLESEVFAFFDAVVRSLNSFQP